MTDAFYEAVREEIIKPGAAQKNGSRPTPST